MSLPVPKNLTESQQPEIIASNIVLFIIGTVGVFLRFWARRKAGVGLWWDDWLVIFAWFPFLLICGSNFFGVKYGAGRHMLWVIQNHPTHMESFLKYIYAVEIMYAWVMGPLKCSICCLYIRLFGIHKLFRWYIYAIMVVTVFWGLATFFGSVFQCDPVPEAWNPMNTTRSNCIDLKLFLIGTNTVNAILDFMILVSPIHLILQLQLSTRKKVLVIGVLVLGAGETAFSVVRLVKLTSLGVTDLTWDYVSPIIWSTVEPSIGLLCACVPVMGALLPKSFMERIGSSSRSRNRYYYPGKPKSSSYALGSLERSQQFNKLDASNEQVSQSEVFNDGDSTTAIRQTTVLSVRVEDREHDTKGGPFGGV